MKSLIVITCMVIITATVIYSNTRDTYSDTWVGVDQLGRPFPTQNEVGEPRADKQVGVFYHNWHEIRPAIHDITKILEANPDNPNYGPVPRFHHTTEPYLGYYLSTDRFVIRKHIQMFNDAMVDVIVIDMSNNTIHEEGLTPLLEELQYLRDSGQKTPGVVAFIGPRFDDPEPVHQMWKKYYSQNKYSDLWYMWDGKPLILAEKLERYTSEMKEFFTWRESWARTDTEWFGDGKDKWPWMTRYPQNYGWHIDPNTPEATSVSAAFRVNENIGRSYHNGVQPPYDKYYLPIDRSLTGKGLFFQDQWDAALEVDPRFIFLTGWNEFTAQHFELVEGGRTNAVNFLGKIYRLPEDSGTDYFVALFNQEYSRCVEPTKTGIKDNYYYQFVSNVRKYKGVRSTPISSAGLSIAINNDFSQWAAIRHEYRDDIGDVYHRDHPRYDNKATYTNRSGRNDIVQSKVTSDSTNLYFYVQTDAPLTPHTGLRWMYLLINVGADYEKGWHGYDYLLNHSINSSSSTVLKRHTGSGFAWDSVASVDFAYHKNQMHIAIPLAAINISDPHNFTIDFKWADNSLQNKDIMDFIDRGDVAPNGRFNYRFEAQITDFISQRPYREALLIPGTIEAEHFDIGGQGISYFDSSERNQGGAYRTDEWVDLVSHSNGDIIALGHTRPGEWVEYTVDIKEYAEYIIQLVVSSMQGGGSLNLQLGGNPLTGSVSIPSTGAWDIYDTIDAGVFQLEKHSSVLRVNVEEGGFNLDKIIFTKVPDETQVLVPVMGKLKQMRVIQAKGGFIVTTPEVSAQLEVFNLQGKSILKKSGSFKNSFVPVTTNGIYFVRVSHGDRQVHQKIVVNE